jgi:hypothetical protein
MPRTLCQQKNKVLEIVSGWPPKPCGTSSRGANYLMGQPPNDLNHMGEACVSNGMYSLGYIHTYPNERRKQDLCNQSIASMCLCNAYDVKCRRNMPAALVDKYCKVLMSESAKKHNDHTVALPALYPLRNAEYDGCQGCRDCETSEYNKHV